ncbi:MAG: hypothetical protein WD357_05455 [Gracilimonas sp.]
MFKKLTKESSSYTHSQPPGWECLPGPRSQIKVETKSGCGYDQLSLCKLFGTGGSAMRYERGSS